MEATATPCAGIYSGREIRPCRAGDLGVRRLAKTMDNTAMRMHLFVGEQVWPQLQLVVFLLGELYGLTSCAARHASVGLQVCQDAHYTPRQNDCVFACLLVILDDAQRLAALTIPPCEQSQDAA